LQSNDVTLDVVVVNVASHCAFHKRQLNRSAGGGHPGCSLNGGPDFSPNGKKITFAAHNRLLTQSGRFFAADPSWGVRP
jgi:hypothetical protein